MEQSTYPFPNHCWPLEMSITTQRFDVRIENIHGMDSTESGIITTYG